MSALLFGVPGKLKQLLTRVPANNAAQIAKLDDTITSRAPAGTAVSNTVLTPAKIALLNNLDAAISSLQSEYSASVRHASIFDRTGIKNIFYTSVNGYGTGVKTSAVFSGNYTVVRDHTFIVPLCFGGIYQFNWTLSNTNKTVQFYPLGGTSSTYHAGNCIVIEFNG